MKNIIESLKWRYATKKFDPNRKIDKDSLSVVLEALRLSPSSYGLQPWRFIIVNNPDVRIKIREAGYDQAQITEASNFIVFANKKDINAVLVDEYLDFAAKEKGIDVSKLQGLGDMIKGSFSGKSEEDLRNWASRQVYLAAGVLLTACASLEIDACPMEGVQMQKIDEILGLPEMNLETRIVVAIGYRSPDDKYSSSKKIRFPNEKVFIEIN